MHFGELQCGDDTGSKSEIVRGQGFPPHEKIARHPEGQAAGNERTAQPLNASDFLNKTAAGIILALRIADRGPARGSTVTSFAGIYCLPATPNGRRPQALQNFMCPFNGLSILQETGMQFVSP